MSSENYEKNGYDIHFDWPTITCEANRVFSISYEKWACRNKTQPFGTPRPL